MSFENIITLKTGNFSIEQKKALSQPIDKSKVSFRDGNKSGSFQLAYVESWHVIKEANRIFGFDGWSSETIELKLVSESKDSYNNTIISYNAKVRVTVGDVVKEGIGSGHGRGKGIDGEKHESAAKEAESDARKRALMQFGDQFGLSLYDKDKNWQKQEQPDRNRNWRDVPETVMPRPESFTKSDTPKQEQQAIPKPADKQEVSLMRKQLLDIYQNDRKQFDALEKAYKGHFEVQGKFSDHIQEPKHLEFIRRWVEAYTRAPK